MTQTQNVGVVTSWWAENWGWVVVASLALVGVATPGGRKAVSTATKFLLAT